MEGGKDSRGREGWRAVVAEVDYCTVSSCGC
jgi:hypothetical protein